MLWRILRTSIDNQQFLGLDLDQICLFLDGNSIVSLQSGMPLMFYCDRAIADSGNVSVITTNRYMDIHPGQKAIIIDGFAETDDVKETQRLGAGKYVKKPFRLEKLGLTIKEALKNYRASH